MFQHLNNIDTAFKHVRLFSAVLVVACTITCCYTVFSSLAYVRQARQQIYVLTDQGKVMEAFAVSKKDNTLVEARDHLRRFHELFFTLVPDDKANQQRIRQAFYLADRSAKEQYDNLKEDGYFHQIVTANISQSLEIDSVVVHTQSHPYAFDFYGKERIERPTATIIRNLHTTGVLRDLGQRTDNNPHGFLIEKWTTLDNHDLQILKK